MTPKQFTRVNGCEFIAGDVRGTYHAVDETGEIVASIEYCRDPRRAPAILADAVLRRNRFLAMQRDDFKCVRCSSGMNLHAHHKIHRGMGGARRDDRVPNLETLCHDDHRREHGG